MEKFSRSEIKRIKDAAGSEFGRAISSREFALLNTHDDRLDMAKVRSFTRSIKAEGASGSGYLSGQTFIHPLHLAPAGFACYGVFVMPTTIGGTKQIGEDIYARVGYIDSEGEAHFPNEDYKLLNHTAPINYIPASPDAGSNEFIGVESEGTCQWFLETTQPEGADIDAMAELIGYDTEVPTIILG